MYKGLQEYRATHGWNLAASLGKVITIVNLHGLDVYVNLTGSRGDAAGVEIFVGTEGLRSLLETMDTDRELIPDYPYRVTCLIVRSADRDDLPIAERGIIRDIGLKPRGKGNWPMFIAHAPGLPPVFARDRLLGVMAETMKAINDLACMAGNDPRFADFVGNKPEKQALIEIACKPNGKGNTYSMNWVKRLPTPAPLPCHEPTELQLKQVEAMKRKQGKSGGVLELYGFRVPGVEECGDSVYCPYAIMIADPGLGIIRNFHACKGRIPDKAEYAVHFIRVLDSMKSLPREIHVSDGLSMSMVNNICQAAGIRVVRKPYLPMAVGAFKEMMSGYRA